MKNKLIDPYLAFCKLGKHSVINDAYIVYSSDGGKLGEYYNYMCKHCGKKYDGIDVHGTDLCNGMLYRDIPEDAKIVKIRP